MVENILIIKPSSIGDVAHALPVLAKLRGKYPEARISWLVGTGAAALLEQNPAIDRLYYFRRGRKGLQAAKHHYRLVKELAWADFDCVIDLQGLLRSGLFTFVTKAPMRIGLSDAREGARFFYTHTVKTNGAAHAVERYLRVGEVLGFDSEEPEFSLEAAPSARAAVGRILEGEGALRRPYFVLSPGARWRSKLWPAEHFAKAAALLAKRFGGTYFVLGTPSAAGQAGEAISGELGAAAVNLVGRTSLAESIAFISIADLVITPDTGLLHIADALGTPLVALFGPTDPRMTGPYLQRERVMTAREACPEAPCFKRECESMVCMRGITPEEVFERAGAVLEGTG